MLYKFCVKHTPEIITIKQLIDNRGNSTFISFNPIENIRQVRGFCVSEIFF